MKLSSAARGVWGCTYRNTPPCKSESTCCHPEAEKPALIRNPRTCHPCENRIDLEAARALDLLRYGSAQEVEKTLGAAERLGQGPRALSSCENCWGRAPARSGAPQSRLRGDSRVRLQAFDGRACAELMPAMPRRWRDADDAASAGLPGHRLWAGRCDWALNSGRCMRAGCTHWIGPATRRCRETYAPAKHGLHKS